MLLLFTQAVLAIDSEQSIDPKIQTIFKQVANYQEIFFIDKKYYFSCYNQDCNVDTLPEEKFEVAVSGTKVNYQIFYRENSTSRNIYLWDKANGGIQPGSGYKWPEVVTQALVNTPDTIKDPNQEQLKKIIKILHFAQEGYFVDHDLFLPCKNQECLDLFYEGYGQTWKSEGVSETLDPKIEVECKLDDVYFIIWIRHRDEPSNILKFDPLEGKVVKANGWLVK